MNMSQNNLQKEVGPIECRHDNSKPKALLSNTCNPQYNGWQFKHFIIKLDKANNCVKTSDGQVVMVENFATLTSNKPQVVVIGSNYVRKEEFFDNPCK